MDTYFKLFSETLGAEESETAGWQRSTSSLDAGCFWSSLEQYDCLPRSWTESDSLPNVLQERGSAAALLTLPQGSREVESTVPEAAMIHSLEVATSGRTPKKVSEYQDRVRQQRLQANRLLQIAESNFSFMSPDHQGGRVRQSIISVLSLKDGAAYQASGTRPSLRRVWSDPLPDKMPASSGITKLARRREQQKYHKQHLRQSDLRNYQRLCQLAHIACEGHSQHQETSSEWNLQQDEIDLQTLRSLFRLSQAELSTLSTLEQRLTKTISGPLCSALSQQSLFATQ